MLRNAITRRTFAPLAIAALLALSAPHAASADAGAMTVFKSPWCGCCGKWVDHMRAAGFAVQVTNLEDLAPAKTQFGVAPDLEACHTAVVDGYVIEGHVPAADVQRLLSERPKAAGLAVPGMPAGSPGMEQGGPSEPYAVVLFDRAGTRSVYTRY